MSLIKNYLIERDREEEALYEAFLDFLHDNEELFPQLAKPTPEDVMGYEE